MIIHCFDNYVIHKQNARKLYEIIRSTTKPVILIDTTRALIVKYPFFEESLLGLWEFFLKISLLTIDFMKDVLNIYYKYMDVYSASIYTPVVLEQMLVYVTKITPDKYIDAYTGLLLELHQRKININDLLYKQVFLCINEQDGTMERIKRLLDVARDSQIKLINSIFADVCYMLCCEYGKLNILPMVLTYLRNFIHNNKSNMDSLLERVEKIPNIYQVSDYIRDNNIQLSPEVLAIINKLRKKPSKN